MHSSPLATTFSLKHNGVFHPQPVRTWIPVKHCTRRRCRRLLALLPLLQYKQLLHLLVWKRLFASVLPMPEPLLAGGPVSLPASERFSALHGTLQSKYQRSSCSNLSLYNRISYMNIVHIAPKSKIHTESKLSPRNGLIC